MDAFNPIPSSILDWMESTWLNHLMLDYSWSWVAGETLHFLGMCMLFGPIIIMDLRLLGFDRLTVPAAAVHALIPLTIAGFAINLITGILFCFGNPHRYAPNISFQIKMVLVVLAGVNAIYFWRKASHVLEAIGPNSNPPLQLKIVGLTSLLLWTGVLCFGRLIPYLGTG
jgi:hypothetical protein